jgi:hypothetical protein
MLLFNGDDGVINEAQNRYAELQNIVSAISPSWELLKKFLENECAEKMRLLVEKDSEELRGRIKQLLELKDLPARLTSEMRQLEEGIKELSE